MHFNISNELRVEGRLHANGEPGRSNSGGGAGGSIYINVGHLDGGGSIEVTGGTGGKHLKQHRGNTNYCYFPPDLAVISVLSSAYVTIYLVFLTFA